MVSTVCGGNQVQVQVQVQYECVLPTVKHCGGSVMVWDCMSAVGTGELQFSEGTMNASMYCDILGCRTVFQNDNDPKHLQDDHCLAKDAESKGDGLAKHVSRPKLY